MSFQGKFSEQILKDQISTLNVAFLVPKMRKEYGGCAANIAYNLNAIGDRCVLLGCIGKDGKEYLDKFIQSGIDTSQLVSCADEYTAQAFITTDDVGNQITSFHPGAMVSNNISTLSDIKTNIGIVSPNSHQAMVQNSNEFFSRRIDFIFDPGQALPMFTSNEIIEFVTKATWIAVNEYESEILCKKTGLSLKELSYKLQSKKNSAIFQTLGDKGCRVITKEVNTLIKPIKVTKAIDPTGCGDAFRAGIIYGLVRGVSPEDSAAIGNVIGSIKVQSIGGQNHSLNLKKIMTVLQKNYQIQI